MLRGKRSGATQFVVLALLLATTVPAAVGAEGVVGPTRDGPQTDDMAQANSLADGVAQADPETENNSTTVPPVAHRNPSEVGNDSDLSNVESWLAREMAGRLGESVNLSQEDRERARQLIGNNSEYARLAEQYAEVSSEAGGGAGNLTRFSVVGTVQRELFADVQRYQQTLDRYQQARTKNQTLRTRRLAHQLERRTAEVNRTATRLNRSYANLSSSRQAALGNVTRTIGGIRANVTESQMTVRNQTLVRTRLSVRAVDSNGSFADPVVLGGRLQAANGTPIANQRVTFRIGNETMNATTDRRGRFRVDYRPTLQGVGTHPRTVEFRPANESMYLGRNATVRFGVRQITPTVSISNRTQTVRYNQTIAVNGTVGHGGVGAAGVPVVVTVDGVRVGNVRTGPNGSFGVAARLPANVSTGRQQVRARLALENASRNFSADDLALAPTDGSAGLTVESSPTALSITHAEGLNGTAFLTGRLTTDTGMAVPNQTVVFRVDGTTVGRTTTNATGGYATSVTVPPGLSDAGSAVRVVAVAPASGNLEPARTNASVVLASPQTTASDRPLWLGAAGLVGLAVISVVVWQFRSDDQPSLDEEAADEVLVEPPVDTDQSPEELLDAARSALDADRFDAAAAAAYAAVRTRLSSTVTGSRSPRTHWEFYRACRDAEVSDNRLRQLDRLTRLYEQAAFAADSVEESDAMEAVTTAESFSVDSESDE